MLKTTNESNRYFLILTEAKEELTPKKWDRSDPRDLVKLRYQSEFLNDISTMGGKCVSHALAGDPWRVFRLHGISEALDLALHRFARQFNIDFDFVIDAARRTLQRWARQPSAFEGKSWTLSHLEPADFPRARVRGRYGPVKQKRQRDGRDKYIAFECLAQRLTSNKGYAQIARELNGQQINQVEWSGQIGPTLERGFALDPSNVRKHIQWAAMQLGIVLPKLKRGAPVRNRNAARRMHNT